MTLPLKKKKWHQKQFYIHVLGQVLKKNLLHSAERHRRFEMPSIYCLTCPLWRSRLPRNTDYTTLQDSHYWCEFTPLYCSVGWDLKASCCVHRHSASQSKVWLQLLCNSPPLPTLLVEPGCSSRGPLMIANRVLLWRRDTCLLFFIQLRKHRAAFMSVLKTNWVFIFNISYTLVAPFVTSLQAFRQLGQLIHSC